MNIDLKKLSRLQAMLAEYEKINGTVSANIGDAISCTAGCAGTCAGAVICALLGVFIDVEQSQNKHNQKK